MHLCSRFGVIPFQLVLVSKRGEVEADNERGEVEDDKEVETEQYTSSNTGGNINHNTGDLEGVLFLTVETTETWSLSTNAHQS